ncbi:MAG: hypothetical protein JWS12_327 [Candidatus Saccharibacteria bacterium]|nr:hypothetical protein [Candidatus Saccharibacteria bacterium]
MSTILYIEPDAILAKTYIAALERAGYTVKHYKHAAAAMLAADAHKPDLVIMELQLAGHNGVDFLYEFRSYSEWQRVPIIIVSVVPPYEAGFSPDVWQQLGVTRYFYKQHTSLAALVDGSRKAMAATIPA